MLTTQQFIPELVEMQKSGRFPLEKLCKTYSYTELKEAIEDMNAGKVGPRPLKLGGGIDVSIADCPTGHQACDHVVKWPLRKWVGSTPRSQLALLWEV